MQPFTYARFCDSCYNVKFLTAIRRRFTHDPGNNKSVSLTEKELNVDSDDDTLCLPSVPWRPHVTYELFLVGEQIQTWIMVSFSVWHHTVPTEIYLHFERTRCLYKRYAEEGIITFHLKRSYVSTRMDGIMSQDSILHSQCCGNLTSRQQTQTIWSGNPTSFNP
jgi:hypothetical protein